MQKSKATWSKKDWLKFLEDFAVNGYDSRVFILGCFAPRVTLYAQQVRALNLITALLATGKLSRNKKMAIIGAGAAGLTAAAGAQFKGVQVWILEELEGVLEIQQNNRQRWLHPHIIDWPLTEYPDEDARLPLLNWSAGYAEDVAHQISQGWEDISKGNGLVKTRFNIRNIRVDSESNGLIQLVWNEGNRKHSFSEKFDAVVFSVGFGLEKQSNCSYSYWSEDDIDGGLRRLDKERWLISGGDEAPT